MNDLRHLGDWLRADFIRPVTALGALLLLNWLSARFLDGAAAVVVSVVVVAVMIFLVVAYLLGRRS